MTTEAKQYNQSKAKAASFIALDQAIARWNAARHTVEKEPCSKSLGQYNTANDELGQSLARWQKMNPALAEQFRYFFKEH